MRMRPNRINYTPTPEENNCIERLIQDNTVEISRLDALRHFVKRGIEAWQRENRSKSSYDKLLSEIGHRKADRLNAQEAGK